MRTGRHREMCRWLEVSRSGFYEWRSRRKARRRKAGRSSTLIVKKHSMIRMGPTGTGACHAQLARWGVRAGPELVRALMRELGLVACQPRPWRPATPQQGEARHGSPTW